MSLPDISDTDTIYYTVISVGVSSYGIFCIMFTIWLNMLMNLSKYYEYSSELDSMAKGLLQKSTIDYTNWIPPRPVLNLPAPLLDRLTVRLTMILWTLSEDLVMFEEMNLLELPKWWQRRSIPLTAGWATHDHYLPLDTTRYEYRFN